MFDVNSPSSIIEFAKKLKGNTLRNICDEEIQKHGYKGKGNFGQILEKFYFGYEPNSKSEPDFIEAGIELKSSPLKVLKNGSYRAKERLVLNIINYLTVHAETFENSSFWKKNAHLLLVFYLHNKEKNILDYLIKLVDDWKYPEQDLVVIKKDWEIINTKIKNGKAHELSEGDTFYLGACTKGSTALKSLREQPFSKEKAKQRAYSLKQGYVNHIIACIAEDESGNYGKIIDSSSIQFDSIENIVIKKFSPFYNKTPKEIESSLKTELNSTAKSYYANLTKAILGIQLDKRIEEFEKANIEVKTVRLTVKGIPKEDISFPTFKYEELINESWDESNLKDKLEKKFFFVFYQIEDSKLVLKKVKFWNMPYKHISEAKKVWKKTIDLLKVGRIVKEIKNNRRLTFFPNSKENKVSHVRPHAQNRDDCYPLPIKDQLTGATEYTKHCFWLNKKYIKEEIFIDKKH